jgi:hypothetical protein
VWTHAQNFGAALPSSVSNMWPMALRDCLFLHLEHVYCIYRMYLYAELLLYSRLLNWEHNYSLCYVLDSVKKTEKVSGVFRRRFDSRLLTHCYRGKVILVHF